MAEICIGTSGFSYDEWKGEFYPSDMTKNDFLKYYSLHFSILELNYSYYRVPEARFSEQMVEKTNGKVEFVVKAFRKMTHEISGDSIKYIVPLFLQGIAPFAEAKKLGTILLQFPQSFHYTPKNRLYLGSLLEAISPLPISVEFRQKEWLKKSVYDTLKKRGVGFVSVDEPNLPSLIPPVTIHTSDLGYIRFHGRNKKKWYGTDSRERHDYLYSEEEIKEWLPKIEELSKKTEKLFVFFNNHAKAQAVTNARMLIKLLES